MFTDSKQITSNWQIQLHFLPAVIGSILLGLILGQTGWSYFLVWLLSWFVLRLLWQLAFNMFYLRNRSYYWASMICISLLPYLVLTQAIQNNFIQQ